MDKQINFSANETLDPLSESENGEAGIENTHTGSPVVSPDQVVDITAWDRCDNACERHAEEAPCGAGASFCEFTILQYLGIVSHRTELESPRGQLTTGPTVI